VRKRPFMRNRRHQVMLPVDGSAGVALPHTSNGVPPRSNARKSLISMIISDNSRFFLELLLWVRSNRSNLVKPIKQTHEFQRRDADGGDRDGRAPKRLEIRRRTDWDDEFIAKRDKSVNLFKVIL